MCNWKFLTWQIQKWNNNHILSSESLKNRLFPPVTLAYARNYMKYLTKDIWLILDRSGSFTLSGSLLIMANVNPGISFIHLLYKLFCLKSGLLKIGKFCHFPNMRFPLNREFLEIWTAEQAMPCKAGEKFLSAKTLEKLILTIKLTK